MSDKKDKKENKITPSQYFDYVKNAKNTITTEALKDSYETFVKLAEKYNRLGQVESLKKLCFLANALQKEEKLVELGINTFVYKDTIEDYIENVADDTVKIIELSRYMREVPDELIEVVEKTKPIFDEFYVVFTDYTGREERKIEKERRDKDPILFGVFKDNSSVADRFYFLGDWVDEYCDLTLDKLINQYTEKKGSTPAINIEIPKTSEELIGLLKSYKIDEKKSSFTIPSNNERSIPVSSYTLTPIAEKKNGFFNKVRSIFKK